MVVAGPLRFVENAPAIACGRSRAVAQRFGPAPIRAGRRHTRLNPGEREWRDERVNRCEDCACEPPVAFAPACGSARVCLSISQLMLSPAMASSADDPRALNPP